MYHLPQALQLRITDFRWFFAMVGDYENFRLNQIIRWFFVKNAAWQRLCRNGFWGGKIKRQSRAVKVTHPPAARRQLHKRMKWAASQVQWSDSVMERLHKQGFLELVKIWRKPLVLSEERLTPREEKPCGFVHHFCRWQKWWAMTDSNRRHSRCKRDALTNWANRPQVMWFS